MKFKIFYNQRYLLIRFILLLLLVGKL